MKFKRKKRKSSTEKQEEKLKRKTIKYSIREGSLASVMSGAGTNYIAPFALILNATNLQIGFLTSFVGLLSPFSQIYGSKLMERRSRKEIVAKFIILQAIMWIPVIALIYLFWKGIGLVYLPWMLIVIYTLIITLGAIAYPSWFSLIGDNVPESKRGKYFGRRKRFLEGTLLITGVAASFLLDFFKTKGMILAGFLILFSVASIARFISVVMLNKHYEPKLNLPKGYYFSFKSFITNGLKTNFGKFVLYSTSLYFAVMIASPFFTVYILEDLQLSYKLFISIIFSQTLYAIIFLPVMGKISDRFGNRLVLKLGAILISLVPLLWLVSSNFFYLILVPQLIAGVGWAAFSLSSSNFIYDSVKQDHRGLCVAYFNILIGIGTFAGALIGGLITNYADISFMNLFLFVFLVSGVLRGLAGLIFIPKIKEIRELKHNPHFRVSYLNPTSEIVHDLVWIKKKISKIDVADKLFS